MNVPDMTHSYVRRDSCVHTTHLYRGAPIYLYIYMYIYINIYIYIHIYESGIHKSPAPQSSVLICIEVHQ